MAVDSDDFVVTSESNGQQLLVAGEDPDGTASVAIALDHDDDLTLADQQELVEDLRDGMARLIERQA